MSSWHGFEQTLEQMMGLDTKLVVEPEEYTVVENLLIAVFSVRVCRVVEVGSGVYRELCRGERIAVPHDISNVVQRLMKKLEEAERGAHG